MGTAAPKKTTDRDTDINLVSSPALPADSAWSRNQALFVDADRIAQAEFEEAVADGSYEADPDFECPNVREFGHTLVGMLQRMQKKLRSKLQGNHGNPMYIWCAPGA